MPLNNSAARPLYLQLKDTLLRRIQSGEYAPHQRLPSERDLSREFEVSRITVRQALAELGQHGRVYTRVGKGTYASDPSLHKPLGSLFGFSESVLRHGRSPSSNVLEATLVPASTELAGCLRIASGEELVRLHRLRLADKIPIGLELTHLPHVACPGLLERMADDVSLYAVLEQAYGLSMTTADITLGAALADERTCQLLGLAQPAAVLRSEQTSYGHDGRALEYTQATYRGDGYLFSAVLHRALDTARDTTPQARLTPRRDAHREPMWRQR